MRWRAIGSRVAPASVLAAARLSRESMTGRTLNRLSARIASAAVSRVASAIAMTAPVRIVARWYGRRGARHLARTGDPT